MSNEQLELPEMPRKRVRLEDAEPARGRVRLEEGMVGELPEAEAGPLIGTVRMNDEVVGSFRVDVEAYGRTAWETKTPPPCAGYWEVTDHATGSDLGRWFYDGAEWWVFDAPESGIRRFVAAATFGETYAWRGLRAPHLDGYAWDVTPGARYVPPRPRVTL